MTEAQIRQVLESEAGMQLVSMLQKKGGKTLDRAISAAKTGDADGARQAMRTLLGDREASALLSKLSHG